MALVLAALAAPGVLLPSAFCLVPSGEAVADDSVPDPVPVRRVLLPAERLPAEMKRVGQGVLVQLSRAEFEAKVRRAGRAAAALRDPPRLIEAHYRASLVDTALVGGTAQWKVINPARAAGILALQPFNVALQKVRVQKARFDTTEAVVGDLDGKTLGLLVEQPGEQTVLLDWTARGDPRPAGLHFSLQVPSCPVASLELDLPADRVVVSQDTFLVSGPHEAESPQRRLWRIDFAGRSQVDLELRAAAAGDEAPALVLANLKSRQVLEPDLLQADYDFSLEVPHHRIRELRCEYDPTLRPLEVVVRGLESWETQPGATPGSASLLVIRLREPFQGGPLQVRCLAPLSPRRTWTCPDLRLAGAVLRSETLVLYVHPDVRLENWQSGSFRLTRPQAPDPSAGRTPEEGWQVLSLIGGEPGERAGPRRPRADVKTGGSDFRVRQLSWWQVGPAGSTLTVQAGLEVARGQLFRLCFRVPAGWEVEGVRLTPAGLLQSWAVVQEDHLTTLVVDLQWPVGPGSAPRAEVRLRAIAGSRQAGSTGFPSGTALGFPDLVPLLARFREGALAISIDPAYQAQAECREPLAAGAPEEAAPPWGGQTPDYFYPYRALTPHGSREPAIEGVLRLQLREPRFAARCTTRVVSEAGRPGVAIELALRPEVSSPEAIDLLVSAPVSQVRTRQGAAAQMASELGVLAAQSPLAAACLLARPPYEPVWIWKVQDHPRQELEGHRWWPAEAASRLSALAGRSPLEVASLLAASPPGEWWRVQLGRPWREPLTLHTTLDLTGEQTAAAGEWHWPVPLLSVPAADPMEGEVRLEAAATHGLHVASAPGFLEGGSESRPGPPSAWQPLRYGRQGASLTLAGPALSAHRFAEEAIDRARLTTWVEPDGRLVHDFRFQVRNWRQQTLPLRLPPGARPLAAKEDGCWIARVEPSRMVDGALELPVAAGPGSHLVEVLYTVDLPAWRLWARLESPLPELPVAPLVFQRTWHLPPGVRPLFAHWLEGRDGGTLAGPPARASRSGREAEMMTDSLGGEWTEWQPRAGVRADEPLLVVRRDLMPGFGLALAVGLAVVAWSIRRLHWRTRLAFHLLCLATSGLAAVWLPAPLRPLAWWPALVAGGLMAGWYVWRLASVKRQLRPSALTTAALAGLLAFGLAGRSEAPTPFTVFLVPGAAKAPGAQMVLAPPELLQRLRTLTERAAPWQHRAILVAVRYEGTVADGSADFTAQFQVHCFADGATSLALPLESVQLKEALVDGAAARPVAARPPRDGYVLELQGRGAHTVVVRFEAPVSASGEDRALRFGVPPLAQSQLLLELPASARYLQAVGGRGAQRVAAAGPAPGAPLRLDADLGHVAAIHARWREQGAHAARPVVRVREGYLWDLRLSGSSLVAVLQYTVAKGALTTLVVDLPGETTVRSVEAGRLPGAALDELIPRLREWQVLPKRHRLRVEFQRPVTSGAQLTLELVPRNPPGASPVLTVPLPHGAQAPGDKDPAPLLAYRVEGRRARVTDNLRISRLDDRQAFRDFWQSAGRADPGPGTNVFVFQRGPGGPPFLRLRLASRATVSSSLQDLRWLVGRKRADLTATARVVATDRDLMLVEWEVGKTTVAAVSGPDIRNWSQTGSRVQVWLRAPLGEARLQLTGWLPLEAAAGGGGTAGGGMAFRLEPLRILGAQTTTAFVRVAGADGQAFQPTGLKNLLPLPDARQSDRAFAYVTEQADYAGVFHPHPGGPGLDVRGLILAGTREGRVTFTALLDCEVRDGGLHPLTVRLRHWAGGEARLEGAGLVSLREERGDPSERVWVVVLRPDATGRQRLTVTGTMPTDPAAEMLVPDVTVTGAARLDRWVAVADGGLAAADAHGLASVRAVASALKLWPREAAQVPRAGSAWKITAPDWRLRLRPHPAVIGAGPVQLFLSEQVAVVADSQRWLHQATYWLYNELGTDLSVSLPEGATLLGAVVDGVDATPLPGPRGLLKLPLSGAWGGRVVRLRWVFGTGLEPLDRPDLARPRLAGVGDGPALWTVHVPAGYGAGWQPDDLQPAATPATAAEQDRALAAAQLELSAVLAAGIRNGAGDVLSPQLLAAQGRFYRYCRLAEHGLPAGSADPVLVELMERNVRLADARAFKATRARAETEARAVALGPAAAPGDALPVRGEPIYWIGRPQDASPRLQLHSPQVHQRREAAVVSGLLLAVLLAIWGLAGYPVLLNWARMVWPEQIAVLGCLAWLGWYALTRGWPFLLVVVVGVVAGFLVLVGVVARLVYLGMWLAAVFGSRVSPPGRGPVGTGSSS
jgi:hypothetical protein